MNLFNLFRKDQTPHDPYWDFDVSNHFRPRLNKGDFFHLTGFDFGWFVLEPLSNMIKEREYETERGRQLSYGQKALYYWWYIDAQVRNGGFVQFYYNGYEEYVPTIIKGLEHVGCNQTASLIKHVDNIYQKKKRLIERAKAKDLFDSDLYDKLDALSRLDDKYYTVYDETMSKIEVYIRKNPNEFCVDETGAEYDTHYTGECKTFFPSGNLKEQFHLENGIINGEFESYFENGSINQLIKYEMGSIPEREKSFMKMEFQSLSLFLFLVPVLSISGFMRMETLKNWNIKRATMKVSENTKNGIQMGS